MCLYKKLQTIGYLFLLSKETNTTPIILIRPPIISTYNGVKLRNNQALSKAKIPFVLIINEVLNALIYCNDLYANTIVIKTSRNDPAESKAQALPEIINELCVARIISVKEKSNIRARTKDKTAGSIVFLFFLAIIVAIENKKEIGRASCRERV